MSNDSNERGNDTAAFQVGDRVRFRFSTYSDWREGIVVEVYDSRHGAPGCRDQLVVDAGGSTIYDMRPSECELISRATPAPAPAQTVDLAVSLPASGTATAPYNAGGSFQFGSAAPLQQPATPAPAATPPALDTPTPLDLVAPHGSAVKVHLRDGRPITGALAIGDATGLTLTTATQSNGDGGLYRWKHVFIPWSNVALVVPSK